MGKCDICQKLKQNGTGTQLLKADIEKFEVIMVASDISTKWFQTALICETCSNLANNFSKFICNFMEKEEQLLRGFDRKTKVDLAKALIVAGKLDSSVNLSELIICRICFETTVTNSCLEIRNSRSILAIIVTTCLSQIDLCLTYRPFICKQCHSSLLKFYHFFLLCSDVAQSMKKDVSDKGKQGREKKIIIRPEEKYLRKKYHVSLNLLRNPGKNVSYECQICPCIFDSLEGIMTHINFHEDQTRLSCWKCQTNFATLSSVRRHFLGIHFSEIYKVVEEKNEEDEVKNEELPKSKKAKRPKTAPRCSKQKRGCSKQKRERSNSRLQSNEGLEILECEVCLKRLLSFRSFRKHIDEHVTAKKFSCVKCPHVCSLIKDFQFHMETIHRIRYLFKRVSPVELTNISDNDDLTPQEEAEQDFELVIDRTESVQPPPTEPFHCPVCFENFETTEQYVNHACTKTPEYCCGHCSVVFYSLDELDDHVCERPDTDDVAFVDLQVDESRLASVELPPSPTDGGFKQKVSEKFSVIPVETEINKNLQKVIETLYCAGCGFRAVNIQGLTVHKNHCEMLYKCPYCNYKTDTTRKLFEHCYTTHNTNAIFACDHCKFVASEEESLKTHILIHVEYLSNKNEILWMDEHAIDRSNATAISDVEESDEPYSTELVRVVSEVINPVSEAGQMNRDSQITSAPDCELTPKTDSMNVINIDSDSDDEFVEVNNGQATPPIAKVVQTLDPCEASDLIPQGIPVVDHSNWSIMDVQSISEGLVESAEPDEMIENCVTEYVSPSKGVIEEHQESYMSNNIEKDKNNYLETVKTVTKNNCIVILDDEDEVLQDNDSDDYAQQVDVRVTNDSRNTDESLTRSTAVVKQLPRPFYLFQAKIKNEISKQFPRLKGKEKQLFIADCWKNMTPAEKKVFVEESHLRRIQFYQRTSQVNTNSE